MTLTIDQLMAKLITIRKVAGGEAHVWLPKDDPVQAEAIGNLELWPGEEGGWDLYLQVGETGGGETRMRYAATMGGVLNDYHEPYERPPEFVVPTWTPTELERQGPPPEVAQKLREVLDAAPDDAEDFTSPFHDELAAKVHRILKNSGA